MGTEEGKMGEKIAGDILLEQHVNYFKSFLNVVPGAYTSLDTNRLLMVYFALSALDILGALHQVKNKDEIVEWVYGYQVVVTEANGPRCGGFMGGGYLGPMTDPESVTKYHESHISMTYCALLILTILGDDLSRVDRGAVIQGLKAVQQEDGSFQAAASGTEKDMRFVFCACAISFMLQDFCGVEVDKTAEFVLSSQSFDGGFGILPNQEAHSGAIYCATAALALLGKLETADLESLIAMCASRQIGGFNGRINKVPDTCYTFWVGGSLQVLGLESLIEEVSTRKFLLSCQSPIGGFSKHPPEGSRAFPDILHSYYSICGLSLIKEPGFAPINSVLGLTCRAFENSTFSPEAKTATGTVYTHIKRF